MASTLIAGLLFATMYSPPQGQSGPTLPAAKITIGDDLSVVVEDFKDYSGRFTVVKDGTISVPPVGRVRVLGRTLEDVRRELTRRIRSYVRDPRVTVFYSSKADNFVFLTGLEGVEPRQQYLPGLDLRALIAGLRLPPNIEEFEGSVFREGKRIASFNLRELLSGRANVWSGPLLQGDVVTLLPGERIRVWFLNDFVKVGESLVLKGAKLSEAVASVGGVQLPERLSNYAEAYNDRSRVVVRRGGEEHRFRVKNDREADSFVMQSGDTVSVEMPHPAAVAVQGFVRKPATVTVLSGDNVSAALAGVGGVEQEGTLEGVLLVRNNEVRRLDLRPLALAGGAPDVKLQDGDSIIVPKNERTFRILGDANKPGIYAIPDNQAIRAVDAIAMASGISSEGSTRRVVLMRAEPNGVYKARQFNIDEYIKDGKIEANPEILPGDVLFINKPKGGPSTRDLLNGLPSILLLGTTIRR